MANAQIHLSPEACSKHIRDNDTLSIFSSETLAVYVTVREKIDSIVVSAKNNRLWNDTVLRPPFTSDNYLFPLSYPDTGKHTAIITACRADNTVFTLGPLIYYVHSPLKQDSIFSPFGVSVALSTPPVGDGDVLYWWSFGNAVGDTVPWFLNHYDVSSPDSVKIGVKSTGYLWVTDTAKKYPSSPSTFTYEFYRPAAPVIKCINRGLLGDSVISGGDTLVLSVQVIDSSGVGLRVVEIAGMPVTSADNLDYSAVFSGMKRYTAATPDTITVTAVNNLNDSTIHTYYCFYEPTGVLPDLVRLTLINPTSSITTESSSLTFLFSVNKYTSDTVVVRVLQNSQIVKTQNVTDSVKTIGQVLLLMAGRDTVRVNALIHGVKYADTTIIITQDPNYKDTSAPQILIITINGKLYTTKNPFVLAALDQNMVFTVTAFDNESGISSVTIANSSLPSSTPVSLTYSQALMSYVSSSIPFSGIGATVKKSMSLTLTVKNNLGRTATKDITVTKN
jgi:hypothetical protein